VSAPLGATRIALRELGRQPARFAPAVAALALLAVLSILFSGLLDGLSLGATAALRELPVDLIVLDDAARSQIDRSRVDDDVRDVVEAVEGVAETGALAYVRLPVERSDGDAGQVSLLAADHRPRAVPPDLGEGAAADAALAARGVGVGDELAVGDVEVEVVTTTGLVGLGLGGSAWVELERWREVVSEVRPDLAPTGPFAIRADLTRVPEAWPALTVRVADGADAAAVADAIDEAAGSTRTLTVDEAVAAIPGTQRERRVFSGLITVTVAAAWVVVAMFLGLVTIERLPLLSALRAVGLRAAGLAAGLVVQAVMVALAALALAALVVALTLPLLPPTVPVLLLPARMGSAAGGLLVAAILGALGSLRRMLRADPASAMA
jgi:putative ABC transport system permease protein